MQLNNLVGQSQLALWGLTASWAVDLSGAALESSGRGQSRGQRSIPCHSGLLCFFPSLNALISSHDFDCPCAQMNNSHILPFLSLLVLQNYHHFLPEILVHNLVFCLCFVKQIFSLSRLLFLSDYPFEFVVSFPVVDLQ